MKRIILFISLILLAFAINAQSVTANQLNGRLSISAASNVADSTWSITGTFSNSVNKYVPSQIAVNDKLFVQIGANTYVGRISVINSYSDVTRLITFRVICNYPNPPNSGSTIAAIVRATSNGYPVWVDGIPNALQAGIQNYFATLVNTNAAGSPCEQTITKASHGFRKFTPVRWNGTTFVRPTHDTLVPDYIVVDSLTANTFKVSNCGVYTTTLTNGLYWFTSASPGYSLTPDTTKVPLFQALNGKLILNPIVGFNLMSSGDALDSLANGSVTWAKLANPVKDSIKHKRDTFITVPPSTNYFQNNIDNPAKFYNNIYLSCKGRTDTSIVVFLAAPVFEEQKGVTYNIKNDSGFVAAFVISNEHFSNSKRLYMLKRGQTAQVRLLPDAVNPGQYGWAVNVVWDSIGDGNGIYSGDGVLSANRIVESAGKGILWNSIEYFALKSSNHTAQVGNGGFYQEKPLTLSGNKRYGIATQYDSRSTIANGAIVSPGPSFSTSLYHDLGAGTNYEWTDMHTLDTNNLVYGHMYGARYAPGMVMIRAIRKGTGSAYRLQPGLEIEVQPGNSSPWSPHSIFRSGADTLFQVKHSGALQAGKYGLGNMEASDLGKTRANYTPGFATDATIIDVANTNNSISSTTDASGDVTVTIPTMPNATYTALVAVTGTTLYGYTVHAKTTTSFKVRFYNTTTGAAVPVSTSITFDYDVKDY